MSCFRLYGRIFSKFGPSFLNITKMNKQNKCPSQIKNKSNFVGQDESREAKKLCSKNVLMNFQVLNTPVKSESDKKDYKVIKLQNGLIACLISDKSPITEEEEDEAMSSSGSESQSETEDEESSSEDDSSDEETERLSAIKQKMAAAGLCVGVGSFSDPKNIQGLAHFLEHMVFMGSEKFPEENDFDSFIKKGGGSDNAGTDSATTNFFFECLEKHFFEGLDKFAQFFISPLMKRDAMTREREAIESEFQMAVPKDDARKEQFLCGLAKKDSPVNTFSWGNLITLRDTVSDDDLYKGVHEFRKRHYSAHRMTLAVQARLPMEELEQCVVKCFENVPNNNFPPDDFSKWTNNIYDTSEFCRMYYLKPIAENMQLDMIWALPPLQHKYKTKPHQYIEDWLGDEGKGSLTSYLRKKVWALANFVGTGNSDVEMNSMYTLFTVSIVLTAEGLKNINSVIEAVYSYIHLMKKVGPQKWLFDEIKAISDYEFRFSAEQPAEETVEELCQSMQFHPPEHYLTGPELYFEYDPQDISMVLECLKPEKMSVLLITPKLPDGLTFDKKEIWFGTEYTDQEFCNQWLEKWNKVEPYPEMSIPEPNQFITKDFSILPDVENHPQYPKNIATCPLYEIWYRKDQKFKLPIAYYKLYLITPKSVESAKSLSMLAMFISLLEMDVAEDLYPATVATLGYSLKSYDKGIIINASGFNEKLPLVLNVLSKHMSKLSENINPDIFNAVKEKQTQSYYNRLLKPSFMAKDMRFSLLISHQFPADEKYNSVLDITFEDIKKFSKELIENCYFKVLVQGNVTAETAKKTIDNFVSNLGCRALDDNDFPELRVYEVPLGEKCVRMDSLNVDDANSIVTNYYQAGPMNMRLSAILDLMMLLIEEPLFDILRTKEQLGYHVEAESKDTFGILGFTVTVNAQATKNTVKHVNERIEEFMKHVTKMLKELTEEELEQSKSNLIKTKQVDDVELKEEFSRNWIEIADDEYIFDRIEKEVKEIQKITLDELRKWWSEHNSTGNKTNFRKISFQVVGNDTNKNEIEPKQTRIVNILDKYSVELKDDPSEGKSEGYFIKNIKQYRENLTLHPNVFPRKKNEVK